MSMTIYKLKITDSRLRDLPEQVGEWCINIESHSAEETASFNVQLASAACPRNLDRLESRREAGAIPGLNQPREPRLYQGIRLSE